MNVEILKAVPAAGKTKAVLNYVKKSKKRTIIASISRDLNLQSYEFYINNGGYGAVIIDGEHILKHQSVCDVIESHVNNRDTKVLFITHSALIKISDYSLFSDFELFIDEVPDLIELKHMQFVDNMDLVNKYVKEVNGILKLNDVYRDEVQRKYYDAMDNKDTVSVALMEYYRALLCQEVIIQRNNEIYFISDQAHKNWDSFSKITIACCDFDNTFTGVIMKHCYSWKTKDSPLMKRLDFDAYKNTERVTIFPLLRDVDWSKYYADSVSSDNEKSVYTVVKEHVVDFFGNMPFIYSTNSYRGNLNASLGNRVTYNPHGMNNFMTYTNAAALFSYNASPWQRNLLQHLSRAIGLNDDVLNNSFLEDKYFMPIFQFVTRTDIRNYNSNKEISLIVPDLRSANYLKRYLKNAKIDLSYSLDDVTTRQKTGTFPTIFKMTKEEKVKFAYFKRKHGYKKLSVTNPDHYDIVKSFINSARFV